MSDDKPDEKKPDELKKTEGLKGVFLPASPDDLFEMSHGFLRKQPKDDIHTPDDPLPPAK